MTEQVTGGIFIIHQQEGYDSGGQEVTQSEYNAWAENNTVTATDPYGNPVDIVGSNDKISVTDGNTTVGYDNIVQPGDGAGATTYSVAATSTTVADSTTSGLSADLQRQLDTAVENSNPDVVTYSEDPSYYPNGTAYDDEGNLNPGWSLDENNDPVWIGDDYIDTGTLEVTNAQDPSYYPNGTPYDDDGNLNPGWAINPETGEPYFKGGDYIDPTTLASASDSFLNSQLQATVAKARSQQQIENQRKQANEGDWRVKLRLAGNANYLYRDPALTNPQSGILYPLAITDGVVFPYTPTISSTYSANYNTYDLTHSNYRGLFYQNSHVDEVTIEAVFTAQDTFEANYLLAVIHFFRSVTKMFYGQDANRGQPPPLVFLQGLGEYQYNLHPCVVRSFTYNLPNDVDYIRARSVNIDGTNLLDRRDRATLPTSGFSFSNLRLTAANLFSGAEVTRPAPQTLGTNSPTYVPTKMTMQLQLLPVQSRSQVSKQFSLKQFANGDLIKSGFW